MTMQKKDEHVLNELFDDFETQLEQKATWKEEAIIDNANNKVSMKKSIFLIIFTWLILVLLLSFFLKNNDYQNIVFIEPENEELISKKQNFLIYTEFFQDLSWWPDVTQSKFSYYWGEENLEIQENEWIKVTYPKGTYKPSINPRGWAGYLYDIWDENETLAFSYDLKFADNFDFVRWWKLPGLCGWDCPRGWLDFDTGFSVRFSWKKDGFLDTYSVFPGSSKFWDYSWVKMFQFVAGQEYNIKQKIKLNSPGNNDGILQVFVNGKSVYLNTEMIFRTDADVKINKLLFNTFFWWSDDSWATPEETYIIFNNLKVEK